jgi:hypothetical protein
MQSALRQLLSDLEDIGDLHEELLDTHVREAMGEALFLSVLRRETGYRLPSAFGMASLQADQIVASTLSKFASAAASEIDQADLNTFHQRLAAFQDSTVVTEGGNDFEEFFGSTDPSLYGEPFAWSRPALLEKPGAPATGARWQR